MARTIARTGFALLAAAVLSGCWLQPGNDAERSGFAPLESGITAANVHQLQLDWSRQFAAPTSAPAVTIDGVFVSSGVDPNAGTLHRLAPTDGATRWSTQEFAAGNPFFGAQQPTVTGGVVYVAQSGFSIVPGTIMSFNESTGAPLSALAGAGADLTQRGSLLVSTQSTGNSSMIGISRLIVTDLAGTASWNTYIAIASGHVPVSTSAAVSDNRIFLGNESNVLAYPIAKPAACPTTNGVEICPPAWTYPAGSAVQFHPVVTSDHQTVIAPTQSSIVALDTANGARRWTGTLTSKPSAAPAVAGGYVYVPTISGQLAVFSAAGCGAPTCTPVWTAQTGSSIGQPPSITSGGLVYTGSDDGSIHAYSASGCGSPTCTSLWSVATGSKITGGPVNALGRVFVGTADGRIIAYSL
jgi:hypothetical protein